MAEVPGKWLRLVSDCLAAVEREQIGSPSPVVDHEVIPAASGSPEDMTVWCICRTRTERRRFADTEQSRFVAAVTKKLLAAGFPESAVTSLRVRVTSRDEVEAGGGKFNFAG
jgi:hypothetical protein